MLVGLAALFLGEKITCRSCSGWRFVSWHAGDRQRPRHQGEAVTNICWALRWRWARRFYAIAALIIKRLTGTPPHLIALIRSARRGAALLAPFATLRAPAAKQRPPGQPA
jgi:hypothetical protein